MYDLRVYLLDLCIFSYHLHSQTLIWPMDPYYEQLAGGKSCRAASMTKVHTHKWLPPNQQPGSGAYHGPSSCTGWQNTDNQRLDPIVSRYDRLYPWRPSFTRPYREKEPWIIYNTPVEITDPINKVYMVRYDTGGTAPFPYLSSSSGQARPVPVVDTIHAARPPLATSRSATYQAPPATDLLYCFEGGTGGSESKAPHWSMMGYVLVKVDAALQVYDVFIVFRGSRSGSLRPFQSNNKEGNPDWATDLAISEKVAKDEVISSIGSVVKGFRSSLKTILPTLMAALAQIHVARNNAPPRYIHVTGHSLGGALAGQFASAMLLGSEYGPNATGPAMPRTLQAWPWSTMRLITFSSPTIGGKRFHTRMDQTLPSLRIWAEGDPITQERYHFPIGVPYRVPNPRVAETGAKADSVMSQVAHQPYRVRRRLITDQALGDKSIPAVDNQHKDGNGHIDEPWVLKTTFKDVLSYFKNNNRTNRTDFAACLRMGDASDFASEFIRFLGILDPNPSWTSDLIGWIQRLPQRTTPAPFSTVRLYASIPDNMPIEFGKYLTVCLVLCAFSRGVTEQNIWKLFDSGDLFTKNDIENFK